MATNISSSRETRRRRIVDRGSDRLALITGKIHNLPPSSADSPPPEDSSLPLISPSPNLQSHLFSDQAAVPPLGQSEISSSLPSKQVSSVEPTHIDSYNAADRDLNKGRSETNIEGLTSRPHEVISKVQPSFLPPTLQEQLIIPADREQHSGQLSQLTTNVFTLKKISSAITTLEETRILCSVGVAFLAVLSYLGFPLLGSTFLKNTILAKPLYLVLLTNLTILLAKLLQKPGNLERTKSRPVRNIDSVQGSDWTEQLGNVMELGFTLQKNNWGGEYKAATTQTWRQDTTSGTRV